jgi:arylsulfatase A-like enzyme
MFDKPGYEGHLSDRIIPIPALLKEAGYHTYIAGKWHLGKREEDSPFAKGFERSFTLLQGGGNHFNNIGIELKDTLSTYREDGKLVDYPEGEYSTEVYTNKLMEFIKGGIKDQKPFFAFAAYTSPHWPLQVPEDYIDRYAGNYDMGYDSLRVLRFASLKKAGMIAKNATLPPRLGFITPWDSLSEEVKKMESRKMELYAAMIDNLDHHVGRLIEFLKAEGLYDNTIIIFMSDNGAANNDFYNEDWSRDFLRSRYENTLENMGRPNSFVSYGPQWAQAGAAPFNRYKSFTTEGGMIAPFIISGKNIPITGEIKDTYFTVMDLAPTFYELAGATYPGNLGTPQTRPLLGKSILTHVVDGTDFIHDNNYGVGLGHRGHVFYRKGNWKIVQLGGPSDERKMMLFNLAEDLGETTDLSKVHPEKFDAMLKEWRDYMKENGILLEE